MAQLSWEFDLTRFKELFPDISKSASDAQLNFDKDTAVAMFNACEYSIPADKYDNFYFYLIAHIAALSIRGANGGAGALTSASEGSVSVGFQGIVGALSGSFFSQTPYGQIFWRLIRPYLSPKFVSGKPSGVF
ncbi:MAG: DUF4054 domain-containing protein [Elusimicrobiota bacterium]|jgi:hypothetical protein|nr:DUF4054 domain-containing protein [Elusimicrobiota bacterium]